MKQLCYTHALSTEEHKNFSINAMDPGFDGWERKEWFVENVTKKSNEEEEDDKTVACFRTLVIIYVPAVG